MFLILISGSFYGQKNKVEFNYDLFYKMEKGEIKFSVSNVNNKILLIDYLPLKQKHIIFDEYDSLYSLDEKNKLNYQNLEFRPMNYRNENYAIQLISTENVNIENYDCIKYTIKIEYNKIFEIYITQKNNIDNTAIIYFDIPTKIKSIFKPGLIVKMNFRYDYNKEFNTFFNLEKIVENSAKDLKISVDLNEIEKRVNLTKQNFKYN